MTAALTDSVSLLEEMFAQDVPCGGNHFPVDRRCPNEAAAELANTHVNCRFDPANFKCGPCYMEWLAAAHHAEACVCTVCGWSAPPWDWYRPI